MHRAFATLWAVSLSLSLLPSIATARTHRSHRARTKPAVQLVAPANAQATATNSAQPPASTEIKEPEPAPLELPEPDPAPRSITLAAPAPSNTTPAPVNNNEEVVEVIEGLGVPTPPPRPVATEAPPADSFQFAGFTRARFSVGLIDTSASTNNLLAVPHDRLVTQGQLYLRARYARGRWFEAVLSGLLSSALFEQDARPPDSFNLFNGQLRSASEANLREAYIGLFFGRFDLRIGQQRTVWGRGDAFTPNDVLNPVDLRDQFLTETEVVRLPTVAIRGDLALGPTVLSAIVQPYFQPNRFESYGGNWALIQPDAPAIYRALASSAATSLNIDPTLYPSLQPLLQQTALPPADLSGTAIGARLAVSLHRFDFDVFYHYGYDYSPSLQIDPALSASLAQIDTSTVNASTLSTQLLSGISAGSVSATYIRRHHVGLSAVTPAGPLVLRGDFAADSQLVFTGSDLQGVVRPSVQTVLGAEYQTGDFGKVALLELHYQYIHDLPSPDALLFQRTHNVSAAALLRWTFFRDTLQLELRGILGITPFQYALRPQIAVKKRGFEVRVGMFIPGGSESTFGHYYARNLSLYTILRYAF